ncbi:MAG: double zinc ribbon domain-containing protein [Candidatus Hodarchaeales archaeon]
MTTSVPPDESSIALPLSLLFWGILVVIGVFIILVAVSSRGRPKNDRRGREYPANYKNINVTREDRVLAPRSRKQTFVPAPVVTQASMENSCIRTREVITPIEHSNSSSVFFPKFCTKCGNALAERDKFCTKCGWTVKPIVATRNQPAESPKREVIKQVVTPTMVYGRDSDTCRKCGSILPVTEKNCSECGALRVKCQICKRNINFTDISGSCPECLNEFHYSHLRETIKVTGKCPMCRIPLKEEEIIMKNNQAK